MNIFTAIKNDIINITKDVYPDLFEESQIAALINKITIDTCRSESHGHLATNIAMVLSKPLRKAPKDIAMDLLDKLQGIKGVDSIHVLNGFINFYMVESFWQEQLYTILQEKERYGVCHEGRGETFNVEFVSANPTGPMHAGHARNAVLGDVICNLLSKIGYKVCREYYINDGGEQIKTLARSLYYRYQEAVGFSPTSSIQDLGLYPGEYLIEPAKKIAEKDGQKWIGQTEDLWVDYFSKSAVSDMMALIKTDLGRLGITMDVYTSENDVVDSYLHETTKALKEKGDVFMGILEKPKGEEIDDWEPTPQLLFRSSAYGDDSDRVIQRSDGEWTYFGKDLANHYYKFKRGFDHYLNVLSADHLGYFHRIKSGFKALTDKTELEICGYQLVNFLENGVPIRMSKRAGNFVLLNDILQKVGKDATRFMMVSRDNNVTIDFDFIKVQEQSKDNPVFYVQYAHARCCSVIRHGVQVFGPDALHETPALDHLVEPHELSLIRALCQWPRQLLSAAQLREPHRICFAMTQLASEFHTFWSQGKENTELRVISPDNRMLSLARVALVTAVACVLRNGFELLGVEAVEEM